MDNATNRYGTAQAEFTLPGRFLYVISLLHSDGGIYLTACDSVEFCILHPRSVQPTALSAAPSPAVCAFVTFTQVESMPKFSISTSVDSAWNTAFRVPSFRHLAIWPIMDRHRLWISGSSRHCAPIRTIKSIPLSFIQLSFYGHPRFPVSSGGSNGLVCSHCSFVNSYPFMLVASHSLVSCSILIFGRTKDMVWKLIFSEYILGLPTDRIDCVNGVTLRGFPVSRGREEWE